MSVPNFHCLFLVSSQYCGTKCCHVFFFVIWNRRGHVASSTLKLRSASTTILCSSWRGTETGKKETMFLCCATTLGLQVGKPPFLDACCLSLESRCDSSLLFWFLIFYVNLMSISWEKDITRSFWRTVSSSCACWAVVFKTMPQSFLAVWTHFQCRTCLPSGWQALTIETGWPLDMHWRVSRDRRPSGAFPCEGSRKHCWCLALHSVLHEGDRTNINGRESRGIVFFVDGFLAVFGSVNFVSCFVKKKGIDD